MRTPTCNNQVPIYRRKVSAEMKRVHCNPVGTKDENNNVENVTNENYRNFTWTVMFAYLKET